MMEQTLSQPRYDQELAGARGMRGTSIYEEWLAAGNVGTIDDFFDAIIAAAGLTVVNAGGLFSVATRAMLAAIAAPTSGQSIYLATNEHPGWFKFSTANLSAAVAADFQGNYVAPAADATGASGAWVRQPSEAIDEPQILRRLAVLEDGIKAPLPVLSVGAYHAIQSTARLVPTYSGPAFRGIRDSDGVAVDVPFTGKSVAPGDIRALRGAAAILRLDKWYDQTGTAARDMTQATAAKRPGVRDDVYSTGVPVLLLDGGPAYIGGPARGWDFTLAATGQACTMFFVADFKASTQHQLLFACDGTSGGRTIYRDATNAASGSGASILVRTSAGFSAWPFTQFRAGPAVYAFRETAAGIELFIDGVSQGLAVTTADMASPGPPPPSETLTAGVLGYTTASGQETLSPNMRLDAFVAMNGLTTTSDIISVSRALMSNFGIPSRFDSRIVIIGDSIGEGGANTYTLELVWYLRQQGLTGLPSIRNISISGKTLAASYADRAVFDAKAYKSGDTVVYVIQAGTNDIRISGTSAASLYATLTSYVAYLKGLGSNVRVVANTILKCGTNTVAQANVVSAYNALVRANTAGADIINDVDAGLVGVDPAYEMNAAILSTNDGLRLHPTSNGYGLLAPIYAAACNAALAL